MVEVRATNPELLRCIRVLKKRSRSEDAPIWRAVAEQLGKPRQRRVTVNVGRIDKHSKEGDTVLVAGRVLGAGPLTHPITVAAFQFSESARLKIEKAGGKCISIEELTKLNPKGTEVKLIR